MKRFSKLLILLIIVSLIAGCLASCKGDDKGDETPADEDNSASGTTGGEGSNGGENTTTEPEFIDYASQLKFNPNSGKVWMEVEVKNYIDGDTTHFVVPESFIETGVLKARYLGLNTPESTGVVEPWGKKASNYTKTQLMSATSIIIESDTSTWNVDSTGSRYLVWVWYKTADSDEYKNLNVEILQQGLAFGSNAASNTYSEYTMGALNQAKTLKLYVFGKDKDPDFYYDGATELSLKELKANLEYYEGKLVRFEAVVAKRSGSTIYVEEYDAENDVYFGMQIFPGYNCNIMSYFTVGNRVAIVGKVQYYENGGTFQISALETSLIYPNDPKYCNLLSTGHSASYREITADQLLNGSFTLSTVKETVDDEGNVTGTELVEEVFSHAEIAHYSTLSMTGLTVKSVSTTQTGDSKGALTIRCESPEGISISIRTADKLTYSDGTDVVAADFPAGTVINVRGIVDYYDYDTSDDTPGSYQIKAFSIDDITIVPAE